MSLKTEAQKNQEQLEREIAEQRAHIGQTIDALEQKFSPGQMLDQVLAYGRENGGEFAQNFVNTIKNNPVPTVLTAIGLAWMMFSSQRRAAYPRSYEHASSSPDYDEPVSASYGLDADYDPAYRGPSRSADVKEKAGQVKEQMKDSWRGARRAGDRLRHSVGHTGKEIRHQAHRASEGFQHLLKDQPLAVGAAGVALGAIIGGSLPSSHVEDKLMGRARDDVLNKAKEASEEITQRVENVGKKSARDIKEDFAVKPYTPEPRYSDSAPKLNS